MLKTQSSFKGVDEEKQSAAEADKRIRLNEITYIPGAEHFTGAWSVLSFGTGTVLDSNTLYDNACVFRMYAPNRTARAAKIPEVCSTSR